MCGFFWYICIYVPINKLYNLQVHITVFICILKSSCTYIFLIYVFIYMYTHTYIFLFCLIKYKASPVAFKFLLGTGRLRFLQTFVKFMWLFWLEVIIHSCRCNSQDWKRRGSVRKRAGWWTQCIHYQLRFAWRRSCSLLTKLEWHH